MLRKIKISGNIQKTLGLPKIYEFIPFSFCYLKLVITALQQLRVEQKVRENARLLENSQQPQFCQEDE